LYRVSRSRNEFQKVIGGTTYITGYAYNLAGEMTQITYPSSRVVQQSFDAIGRLCEVAPATTGCSTAANPYATAFGYNTSSQVTGFNYGNAVATTIGYSPDRLQMTSLQYAKGSTTLFNLTYAYGAAGSNNGQISGITDNVDNGRTVSYGYDGLSRLYTAVTAGSANFPKWGLTFEYDRYGNRTAENPTAGSGMPSNSVAVNPATNRINSSGYAYDASGNMTNDGSNTLVYDAENRTVSATNGSASGTYTYDGNGLRVTKVAGGTTTVYVFAGSKVIAEYDNGAAAASPSREYIYSGAQLLAKIENGAVTYYHADHLSARMLTDSSGNSLGQRGHYPFGEIWYETGITTKLKFTTYERDGESGNDYAMARYHVNRLGRFSSPDAIAGSQINPHSLNRYSYVGNDPISLVDPSGMLCEDVNGEQDPSCGSGE
jgi:RHS repeat-associated protein